MRLKRFLLSAEPLFGIMPPCRTGTVRSMLQCHGANFRQGIRITRLAYDTWKVLNVQVWFQKTIYERSWTGGGECWCMCGLNEECKGGGRSGNSGRFWGWDEEEQVHVYYSIHHDTVATSSLGDTLFSTTQTSRWGSSERSLFQNLNDTDDNTS